MEIWKDVKGFEGLYKVSNLGNVKSVERKFSEQHMKLSLTKSGYNNIVLRKNKRKFNYRVHRMVAHAFIDNPYDKPEVNHKNGIKTDNRVDNLEWSTYYENLQHAKENNLRWSKGWRKLLKSEVEEIRKIYKPHSKEFSQVQLAKRFNCTPNTIGDIVNFRRSYKNGGKYYDKYNDL